MQNFSDFKTRRNRYLFGTDDAKAVKFRFSRQFVQVLEQFSVEDYGEYPEGLQAEISHPRFEIVYENGVPAYRKDFIDKEMESYQPSEEDKQWSISTFFEKLKNDHYTLY